MHCIYPTDSLDLAHSDEHLFRSTDLFSSLGLQAGELIVYSYSDVLSSFVHTVRTSPKSFRQSKSNCVLNLFLYLISDFYLGARWPTG